MDNETRGQLEETMDKIVKDLIKGDNLRNIAEWITGFENYDHLIKSPQELVEGYIIGYTARVLHNTILERRPPNQKIIQRKAKQLEQNPSAPKIIEVPHNLHKKDVELTRSIIESRLPKIREEIDKALNV